MNNLKTRPKFLQMKLTVWITKQWKKAKWSHLDFFPGKAGLRHLSWHQNTWPAFTQSGKRMPLGWRAWSTPWQGSKSQGQREAFDPGVMRSWGGNWEGKQLTPGWDERFSGTSWWSEGRPLPKAAGTIQTNWSLLAASMQAPHLNRRPSLRLTPLRGFNTCE